MAIFSPVAMATIFPARQYGWLIRSLAVAAMLTGLACAHAAAAAETPPPAAVAALAGLPETTLVAAPGPAPATSSSHDQGNVFCNGIRLQDEIELVNVRNVCGCCDPAVLRERIAVETYAPCNETGSRRWQTSDLQGFLTFNPSVPTVIFIHGNQISPGDAKCEGLEVYRRLILHGADAPPMRFVIFSWPSAKIPGLLKDVRVKATRTGPAGYQLAWLIDQMPAETPISLAGFSFGARIITGGLHILAGGNLGGTMRLDQRAHPNRPPMSAFMMASALHAHWLGDGQYHGLAMTQVSRMCLINNCKDRAMVYYDFIEPGRGGPQALGLCGPTCLGPEHAGKIVNRDVSCYVGATHDLMRYLCAPGSTGLFWEYTVGAVAEKQLAGR